MATKKKSEDSSEEKFHTLKITNAIIGSSYSLYAGKNPRRYTQGVVQESTFSIKIPKELGDSGAFNIKAPRTDRLFNPPQINLPFEIKEGVAELILDQTVTLSSTTSPPIGKPARAKKIIKSELKEKVQEASQEILKEEAPPSPTPPRGPGGRFVSEKLIGNKLREEVKKAQGEGTPLDDGDSANNNESGGSEDKPKDSFWDKFR